MNPIPSITAAGPSPATASVKGGGQREFASLMAEQHEEVPASAAPSPIGQKLEQALEGLASGRHRMDAMIAEARSGKNYSPAELLAMQAEVYRISESAALTGKVVEAGVDGMRRLWSMQL